MNKIISLAVMSTVAAGLVAGAPASQAKPSGMSVDTLAKAVEAKSDYSAYRRSRRGYRNAAVGAAVAGTAAALIGGAIAAQGHRGYYDDGYYGRPAYGYGQGYGYSQGYGYGPGPGYGYYDYGY